MTVDADVALVTLDQAKSWLKISGSTEDSILTDLVNRSGALANTYTGRHLKSKEWTEYYDGDGGTVLQLKQFPVTAITSINVDPKREWSADTLVDLTADSLQNMNAGIVRLWNAGGAFWRGRANVKVVYTAGYKDATDTLVPYDLQEAALLIIMYSYKRHYQDQRIGLQSETIGQKTIAFTNESIPKKAQAILDQYRAIGAMTNGY